MIYKIIFNEKNRAKTKIAEFAKRKAINRMNRLLLVFNF